MTSNTDLNGDSIPDLAVGAYGVGSNAGAVILIFLSNTGGVKSFTTITSATNGFTWTLSAGDGFGISVSMNADLNGDGVLDLLVGASSTSTNVGAYYICYLLDRYGFP
jgi:hypothetical protein